MSRPQLFIGNENYSSWSMRAWVLLRALDIDFEEVQLEFHTDAAQRYVDAVLALPAVQEWSAAARQEAEVIAAEEPYAHHYR